MSDAAKKSISINGKEYQFKRLTLGLFKKVVFLATDFDKKFVKAKQLSGERVLKNDTARITELSKILKKESIEIRNLTSVTDFDAIESKYEAQRAEIEKRYAEVEASSASGEPSQEELAAWKIASEAWDALVSQFLVEYPPLEEITNEEYEEISESFFALTGTKIPKSMS